MKIQELLCETISEGEKLSDIKNFALYALVTEDVIEYSDFDSIAVYTDQDSLIKRIKEDFAFAEKDISIEDLPINKVVTHKEWPNFYHNVWIKGSLFDELKEMLKDMGVKAYL